MMHNSEILVLNNKMTEAIYLKAIAKSKISNSYHLNITVDYVVFNNN